MKKALLVICLCITGIVSAQDSVALDLSVYVFDTYEDAVNDSGRYIGQYSSYSWTDFGVNALWVKEEGSDDDKRVGMNQFWGFRIDQYMFRMCDKPKIPLTIFKVKDKVFYVEGYLYLNYLRGDGMESSRTDEAVFYSDGFNTEIYEITKIIRNEKENAEMGAFIECIQKGKKRQGYQAQFNGYMKCIREY